MTPDEVERVRAWHERAYSAMAGRDGPTEVVCLGRTFTVHPKVFPPVGEMMGRVVVEEVRGSDRVLDVGTGSGVNAVLAATRSAEVVAVDINPYAIECAKRNAAAHMVSGRVTFLEGDLFEDVEGTFDLIVFDPPFRWFAPRDELEAAIADEDYTTLTRFMAQAPSRLRPGGRILLHFGTSADLSYLHRLMDQHGYTRQTVAHKQVTNHGWAVDYYVLKLTHKPQRHEV